MAPGWYAIAGLTGALLAGASVYCILTILAAWRYAKVRPPAPPGFHPLSVLKPLAGSGPER